MVSRTGAAAVFQAAICCLRPFSEHVSYNSCYEDDALSSRTSVNTYHVSKITKLNLDLDIVIATIFL